MRHEQIYEDTVKTLYSANVFHASVRLQHLPRSRIASVAPYHICKFPDSGERLAVVDKLSRQQDHGAQSEVDDKVGYACRETMLSGNKCTHCNNRYRT
jgi:hypothetical protein